MLVLLSVLVGVAGLYPYIKSTISGSVRPQLVTWSIWTVLAGVLTLAALLQHQIASAMLSAQALIGCGLVVAFGWGRGYVSLTKLDIACLVGATTGIGSLLILQDPTIALLVAVAVDAVAFIPTLRHAWISPDEESLTSYALGAAAASLALTVAIMRHTNIDGVAYPLYSLVFNGATAAILFISRQSFVVSYSENNGEA